MHIPTKTLLQSSEMNHYGPLRSILLEWLISQKVGTCSMSAGSLWLPLVDKCVRLSIDIETRFSGNLGQLLPKSIPCQTGGCYYPLPLHQHNYTSDQGCGNYNSNLVSNSGKEELHCFSFVALVSVRSQWGGGEAKPSTCHSEEPVVIDAFTQRLHSRIRGKISTTAKKEHTLYHLNETWQRPRCSSSTGSQAASFQPINQSSTARKQANRSILPTRFPSTSAAWHSMQRFSPETSDTFTRPR